MTTWEQALVITGQWTPGGCEGPRRGLQHWEFCEHNKLMPHDIQPPPEGDPAACASMMLWIVEYGNLSEWEHLYGRIVVLGLRDAIARTVVAIAALGEKK